MVLTDAHEPIAPGDRGRCGRWYDYVYFRCHSSRRYGNYDLYMQDRFRQFGSKLGIYNAYQRNKWPRGYSFSRARTNYRVSNDHWTIANSRTSVDNIKRGLRHLLD